MIDPFDWPAVWGLLGAVIYAGPKLTTCLYASEEPRHMPRCAIEAATALVTGTVAAAAFAPWIARYIHAPTAQDLRAIAAAVGMLANTTAPTIIRFLSSWVATRVKGGS